MHRPISMLVFSERLFLSLDLRFRRMCMGVGKAVQFNPHRQPMDSSDDSLLFAVLVSWPRTHLTWAK